MQGRGQPAPKPTLGLSRSHTIRTPRAVVLVVDDDASIREALHIILDNDYSVLDAAHGRTAIRIACTQHVDLVLLDILMPEVDGLEVLQELKALRPNLSVIMMTAVKTIRVSVAAMKLGACDYVTKPFQEEDLLATMRCALEQSMRRRVDCAGNLQRGRIARLSPTHRLLVVGGELGWRATLAVVLARVSVVETAASVSDGLNSALRVCPTAVVLDVGRSAAEAASFLAVLQAQVPDCPVLVVSDDGYLGGVSKACEMVNIRGIIRPPIDPRDLLSRVGGMLTLGIDPNDGWPRFGASVSHVIRCIAKRFDEGLTVESLAEAADVSASHLAHRFRAEVGMSVRNYLTRVRVAIAQDLLAHTDDKLEAIAARVGYSDMFHLSRVFRRTMGTSPSTYRQAFN